MLQPAEINWLKLIDRLLGWGQKKCFVSGMKIANEMKTLQVQMFVALSKGESAPLQPHPVDSQHWWPSCSACANCFITVAN